MKAKRNSRLLNSVTAMMMVIGGLLLTFLLVWVVRAATVTIDTFNEGAQSMFCGPLFGTTSASGVAGHASILGGERDSAIFHDSGSTFVSFSADSADDNVASFGAAAGNTYTGTLVWDGNDGQATTLDPVGLGGVDLTDGSTNDGFLLQVLFDDMNAGLTVEVYSNTNVATYTVSLPGELDDNPDRMDIFFRFDDFNGDRSVFTSTGAIVLKIDGTVQAGADLTIDLMEATAARDYGDLPITFTAGISSANHIPQGLRLGNNCDAEATPNSSSDAAGDDGYDFDDEDGVATTGLPWDRGGGGGTVNVIREGCANLGGCYVNGWIDWNGDGDFDDTVGGASEYIVNNESETTDATETYTFDTPDLFYTGSYFARFRICEGSADCDDPGNTDTDVSNGEVEDYRWALAPTAVTLSSFTATPDGGAVLLEWKTATEIDNLGFNLYRSDALDGQYVMLNDLLIPSQWPGSPIGAVYTWLDRDVQAGSPYYYKLEDVDVYGVRTFHGPVSATALSGVQYRVYLPLALK